jgi:tetratricopeptide (TPR) repeat protein
MNKKVILKGRVVSVKRPPKGIHKWFSETKVFGLFVFLIPFLLYFVTINYGFILDDIGVLEQNRFVKDGFSGIPNILTNSYRAGVNIFGDNIYRPVSQIMFAIEWEFFPANPKLHHFANVLFYALSCFLVWWFLKLIFVKINNVVILLIAMLFAVHPIHTEVVAYIKCRDEIMSLFFLLISFILLYRWYTKSGIHYLVFAAFSYFLALMSKEGVITMLAIFPLMAWFFSETKPCRIFLGSSVMLIPAIIYILIRHIVLSGTPQIWSISAVDNFLMLSPDWQTRIATTVMILGKYLLQLLIPHPLNNDYSYAQIPFVNLSSISFIFSGLVIIIILITIILRVRKKEPWLFGLIFLIISISIYSNIFIIIGTAYGERLMFIPSLGFCIVFILLLNLIIDKFGQKTLQIDNNVWVSYRKLILISGIIILIFSIKTYQRNLDWKNNETLITRDVAQNPKSARLQLHLGNLYRDKARYTVEQKARLELTKKSLIAYQTALNIFPMYDDAQEQAGLAWYFLGNLDMGITCFKTVLKRNPERQDSWNNLGNIYVDKGDLKSALEAFQKATTIHPWFAEAWRNTGSVLGQMGKYEEAISCFMKTIELEPDNYLACQFLGLTYQNLGKQNESVFWFERARSLNKINN